MLRNRLVVVVIVVLVVLALLVVIGNVASARTNPPVTYTVQWDSPETETLARAACFDCHSNETRWPWYSFIAPVSILLVNDVNEGRDAMNFSTGQRLEGREMAEQIESGAMPKAIYLPLHPEANLTAAQKEQLINGLLSTFGSEGRPGVRPPAPPAGSETGEAGEAGEAGEGGESPEPATTQQP